MPVMAVEFFLEYVCSLYSEIIKKICGFVHILKLTILNSRDILCILAQKWNINISALNFFLLTNLI